MTAPRQGQTGDKNIDRDIGRYNCERVIGVEILQLLSLGLQQFKGQITPQIKGKKAADEQQYYEQ